jgi:dTMP kinase
MSKFLIFEGPDFSGKTTIVQALSNALSALNIPHIKTREPGGCEIAEELRALVLSKNMDRLTEAFVFAAARSEHLLKTVIPALKDGKTVICDRFIGSSIVYQGTTPVLHNVVLELNTLVLQAVKELGDYEIQQFIIDTDYDTVLHRQTLAGRELNRLDQSTEKEFKDKREAYLRLIRLGLDRSLCPQLRKILGNTKCISNDKHTSIEDIVKTILVEIL